MNVRVHLQGMMCLICGVALLGGLVSAQKGEAGTYYVATDGSDWNPGTEGQPFQTLGRGIQGLIPGDTLYVKNGTYTGSSQLRDIPSGASWDNPVTIAAYPGHRVVLVSEQDAHVLYFANNSYIVIDGFVIDGSHALDGIKITYYTNGGRAHHIRIQNSEISHAPGNGIFIDSGSDGNEFIHLDIHDNGTNDFHHGLYITSNANLVENCSIHANTGWGLHVYSGSGVKVNNNIIRSNTIYDNGRAGRGPGVLLSSGSGNQVYNNVIFGNNGGINVDYGASDTYVNNNTIHDNAGYGIYIGRGSLRAFVEANDVHDNDGSFIINEGTSTQILR